MRMFSVVFIGYSDFILEMWSKDNFIYAKGSEEASR